MVDTFLSRLETPEARRAVTETVTSLLGRWGLQDAKQAELLGIADMSSVRESGLLPEDTAVLERAGHLLAIGRALARLHPDASVGDWWVTSRCEAFGGVSPLSVMLGGKEGIRRVRTFLESELKGA